jgi:hypothetical protein
MVILASAVTTSKYLISSKAAPDNYLLKFSLLAGKLYGLLLVTEPPMMFISKTTFSAGSVSAKNILISSLITSAPLISILHSEKFNYEKCQISLQNSSTHHYRLFTHKVNPILKNRFIEIIFMIIMHEKIKSSAHWIICTQRTLWIVLVLCNYVIKLNRQIIAPLKFT